MKGFECKRCGTCCENIKYVEITTNDIKRWKSEGRNDIISEINGNKFLPTQGRCPFLEHTNGLAVCGIYETRPEACRIYPLWDDGIFHPSALRCPVVQALLDGYVVEK